ncbi:MAG: hypothetical protein JO072_06300 [Parafilimonas sp.]|nr:hypothetical protein [Parafilimonas sp.]
MKATQILKAILVGIITGAAFFFIPFPFRLFFIFFLIVFCIRFFTWGRWRRNYWRNPHHSYHFWNPSYTQRWQSMSEEERKIFIQKMEKELFATSAVTE